MCEAWPGPRCSYDMSKKLETRKTKLTTMATNYGVDSPEATLALARYQYTQSEYDATPEGLKSLIEEISASPESVDLLDRLHKAQTTRALQTNALNEIKTSRVKEISTLINGITDFYDTEEITSIIESSREETERFALRRKKGIDFTQNETKYTQFIDSLETALKNKYGNPLPEEYAESIQELRNKRAPDAINMTAYEKLPKALERSKTQLVSEIKNAAALQGVEAKVAAEYYEAYRKQYIEQLASLPAGERPDPPESWVRGEFGQSGYSKDPNSSYAPHDPASMYAIYRLRADENAIPDYMKNARSIASIDLETAGPSGSEGFQPEYGKIIEIGIISYTPQGKRVGEYSQLIKPEDSFLNKYGTGAKHIHQIEETDLKGKPTWASVQPSISSQLKGKILLAQNASFEKKWLDYHLEGFDSKSIPVVDTMEISRKHFDLPNHQLKTICENNGVEYTDGHRAKHDAEVAGAAYFKLRRKIKQTWVSKAARSNAPALETTPTGSRWNSKKK